MDLPSLGEMPTRLDLEETEVISIDSDGDNDFVPPEPMYEPDSPKPELVEEVPESPRPGPSKEEGAPNIFIYSREREPAREDGAPNDFTSTRGRERALSDFNNSARPRDIGTSRGVPGTPVQHVSPFFRGTGNRRNCPGRVRPM